MTLVDILKWAASISGIIACFMVSLDLGRRVTGWGFALFVASSICWISVPFPPPDGELMMINLPFI